MALTRKQKAAIVKDNQLKDKDTGSVEVQVALITESINELSAHLIKHKKDKHSRLGLYKKVGQRQKLLAYVRREDIDRYEKLIKKLKIRDKY
jgi:small subunit ribosomal protein S15